MPGTESGGAAIRLQIPAAHQYVRVARMTVSAAVGASAFDVEELEDLRIAVTELVGVLVEAGGPEIDLCIRVSDDGLQVEGTTDAVASEPHVDPLTARILSAIVDDYAVTADGGRVGFTFRKSVPARSMPA